MKSVWKYQLSQSEITLRMPKGAEILTAQIQRGAGLVLWALVEPEELALESRKFFVATTGELLQATAEWVYVGTVQYDGGQYVVHIFEIKGG